MSRTQILRNDGTLQLRRGSYTKVLENQLIPCCLARWKTCPSGDSITSEQHENNGHRKYSGLGQFKGSQGQIFASEHQQMLGQLLVKACRQSQIVIYPKKPPCLRRLCPHSTLSLVAFTFLVQEIQREKPQADANGLIHTPTACLKVSDQ